MARIDHLHPEPAKEAGKATVVVPSQPGGPGNGRPATEPALAADPLALEERTRQIGRQLLAAARERGASVLSSRFWSNRLLAWAMSDPGFKVQLFRFVDAFPTLQTPAEVYQCLVEYLDRPDVKLPAGMELGLKMGSLAKGVLARTVAAQIRGMAGNFIAGHDVATALPKLRRRWEAGIAFSLDLLGEACVSDAEARAYQHRYLDLITTIPRQVAAWPTQQSLDSDHLGRIPRVNVSVKISSLHARTDPIDFEGSLRGLTAALRPLLQAAAERDVFLNFDMEQFATKDLTIDLFQRCCEEVPFPAGLALQAYLRSGPDDARRIIDWTRRTGRQVTVRLIKGAYWDYELIHAEQMGWPVPVWTAKAATDACFEKLAAQLLAAASRRPGEGGVKLAVGTHNIRSIAHTMALAEALGLPPNAVEFQMLYGMADQLKAAVLEAGGRLREYLPIGDMIPGMAYLVRRLLENTSNQSWLRAESYEHAGEEALLAPPEPGVGDRGSGVGGQASGVFVSRDMAGGTRRVPATMESPGLSDADPLTHAPERHQLSPALPGLGDGRPFFNEPVRNFADPSQREAFGQAVRSARVPEVAGGATADDARRAVARAWAAFPAWRGRDATARAAIILGAAAILRSRRDELAGIMIREAGKPWREADADVCEAIDFCEFYARQAAALLPPERLGQFVGENNQQWYEPCGVAAVISPWNFPLAICTGMTAAALVTGNTAIVKPSAQTPGIARAMCEALWLSGVPADALQLLHGRGSVVGAALVRDPQVALIAFTGSKEVGLDILRATAEIAAQQGFVKKVVCEMGGKNAIIVDPSADLDEAVLGVRQSAFGYAGQKCSAASRAIVVEPVYETFLKRLIESTRSLVIGDPLEPGTDVGPVIDRQAAEKIHRYLDLGRQEGRLELACEVPAGLEERVGKPYVGPHIFSGIGPQHRLFHEEIFGPVLSVIRAATFDEALELANATAYKLTGGLFSRMPSHLEAARQRFRVGNLYLNRGITGALVGRQPFGGFGLSGTGTKAGGRDYLLHFVEPRCLAENTMRHGFAPEGVS
jgi:RHH-type proline utilization regulon transcriptional repressor/proline dehydrogenase/delta 1-pyrroline-5-carboxylate dehydrogenase